MSNINYHPAISVIMPVYNIEAYLDVAIQSVLNQTFSDFDLILIDDGSTDGSASIAEKYCKNDKRLRLFRQSNNGLSATRNFGIEASNGEYIYFFDGDDLLAPNALEICFDWARRLKLDLVTFSGEAFSDGSEDIDRFRNYQKPDLLEPQQGEELLVALVSKFAYSSSACLYLTSRFLIDKNNLRFDDGYLHEDESFTPELFCHAERSISLQARLFKRRVRKNSIMTSQYSFTNIKGWVQAVKRLNVRLIQEADLKSKTRAAIRSKQRQILRSARKESERLCLNREYSSLLIQSISFQSIFSIDPLMLVYVRANKIYKYLRTASHYLRFA